MKNKKRFNKTYKQQPTKRQRQQNTKQKTIALFLALLFLLTTYSAITTTYTKEQVKEQQQAITAQQQPIYFLLIKDISINAPDNFRLAHEASAQACQKHGLATTTPDGSRISDCVVDLLAIAATETGASFNLQAIGDNGHSIGLFQICDTYHPEITTAQRQDPFFSADWTLARMINNHYKTNRDYAVRKHNGGINWRTANYLKKVNHYKTMLLAI